MAGLSIKGQMKVRTLQEGFLKEFGLTLRVYDGREFADPTQTLAQVRKKKGSGKGAAGDGGLRRRRKGDMIPAGGAEAVVIRTLP